MSYFLTGATGFIGRRLVERLAEREGTIHVLVREGSWEKLERMREAWGVAPERVRAWVGDLTEPRLGLWDDAIEELRGVEHIFHLAAVYDLEADAEWARLVNVDGTRHLVEFANEVEAGRIHHVSSIAAAGRYEGTFHEDMFAEATGLSHPYYRTKHEAERVIRTECERPFRVYRPGLVVGDSRTGEIEKVDGPYYLFPVLEQLSRLPEQLPLVGIDGGRLHIVPVDFVADAIDHIAHLDDRDGQTFHLVPEDPPKIGEAVNAFARAAGAPTFPVRLDVRGVGVIPKPLRNIVTALPPYHRVVNAALRTAGIPRTAAEHAFGPTRFDATNAIEALAGTGIAVPPLEEYADVLWRYWEQNLKSDHQHGRWRRKPIEEKVVMVTGASSGIGLASAKALAESGAEVLLVARSVEDLTTVKKEIEEGGGVAHVHPADLADPDDVARLVREVLGAHGRVDVLVNNAGMSIRRSIELSYDRMHDFERTMQLNYFGAVRLILGFLPGMRERGYGHIVNVSSIGVQTNTPRFSAYIASKSALDGFSRSVATEVVDNGVTLTTVYMPLVRTPMIEPTEVYRFFPAIQPDDAAEMIVRAVREEPKRIASTLGTVGEVCYAVAPKAMDALMNFGYHLMPESSAARGDEAGKEELRLAPERRAFSFLLRGIHW